MFFIYPKIRFVAREFSYGQIKKKTHSVSIFLKRNFFSLIDYAITMKYTPFFAIVCIETFFILFWDCTTWATVNKNWIVRTCTVAQCFIHPCVTVRPCYRAVAGNPLVWQCIKIRRWQYLPLQMLRMILVHPGVNQPNKSSFPSSYKTYETVSY